MPSPREQFLSTFKREHATTMKVMRALPSGQGEFQPHPRSQTARQLAWTFVMEQALITHAINGTLKLTGSMPKPPESYDQIVDQFDSDFGALCSLIEKTSDDRFTTGTVQFPVGPGTMADYPIVDFSWFMLFDQIHHRGQFSVMLRMAGGKVPSIYGPSGDEPWM
jgi:uncharacterized damage-inducible protein DinB